MSATMKLAKVLDELDIGDPPGQCLLMVLPSRRKLETRRNVLLPAQGGAEDTVERVMTSTSVKSLPWRKDMKSNARLCGADQLKKTTIVTVRAFKTKLTNAEDDIQQTSLHVCSTSDILRDHLHALQKANVAQHEYDDFVLVQCGTPLRLATRFQG